MVLAPVGSDSGWGEATKPWLPVKLLEGLATLAPLSAKPWAARARRAWPHLTAFNFGTEECLIVSSVWPGDLLACVDGARDAGRWRVGVLVPFPGVRSFYLPPRRYANQQTTELHAVDWAVRMAVRLGPSSSSQARHKVKAWDIWQRMLCHLDACKIHGVLCLHDC